jgi:outer membrane protein assembly factor BamB
VAADNAGAFWIDLGADGCTLFYTSWSANVKRFDACARVQRSNFNRSPLPGGEAHDLRVLPDGGVLVSSGDVIARLNASGTLVQTYRVSGEFRPWTGLDLVGDGTFWAGNYESSNVYRFDLVTGAVLSAFNTGTAPHTVVDVLVRK